MIRPSPSTFASPAHPRSRVYARVVAVSLLALWPACLLAAAAQPPAAATPTPAPKTTAETSATPQSPAAKPPAEVTATPHKIEAVTPPHVAEKPATPPTLVAVTPPPTATSATAPASTPTATTAVTPPVDIPVAPAKVAASTPPPAATPATATAPAVASATSPHPAVPTTAPAATPTAAPATAPAPKPADAAISLALPMKEAQGLVALGASLTERGDYGAAEIAYRQVLDRRAPLEPTKAALIGLAHMHRKQGALTKAVAIYERYLKDYPGDDRVPDALLDLGRALRDMGAPRMAIASFYNVINSTLKLPSGSGFEHYELLAKTAQFEIAQTHFDSGQYTEAAKFFSRLRMLDLAPADRARAHFMAGYSQQLAGDLEGAVTTLRSYLEQYPNDVNTAEARFLLATSLRQLKHPKEALAVTLELLDGEKARAAADPKRWEYWQRRTGNQLANDFFQTGNIANALAIYRGLAALSDDPNWRLPVLYQVALCYERLGDIDHATSTYQGLVDAAAKLPSPTAADIARMAKARLAHVAWRDATDREVAELFDSTVAPPPARPAAPKPAPAHDNQRSPATAPAAL